MVHLFRPQAGWRVATLIVGANLPGGVGVEGAGGAGGGEGDGGRPEGPAGKAVVVRGARGVYPHAHVQVPTGADRDGRGGIGKVDVLKWVLFQVALFTLRMGGGGEWGEMETAIRREETRKRSQRSDEGGGRGGRLQWCRTGRAANRRDSLASVCACCRKGGGCASPHAPPPRLKKLIMDEAISGSTHGRRRKRGMVNAQPAASSGGRSSIC